MIEPNAKKKILNIKPLPKINKISLDQKTTYLFISMRLFR